jgi:hypothetical protein
MSVCLLASIQVLHAPFGMAKKKEEKKKKLRRQ